MDESNTSQDAYIKGFNEGYLITEHLPDLSDQIFSSLSDSERSKGFKDGRTQFITEQMQPNYPSWLQTKQSDIDKEISKDIDIDKE